MTRIISPIFRGGSRTTAERRSVRNLVRRLFALLEQQMRATGRTFGVHKKRLHDGTILYLTVDFTGPVPVRRSFVVAAAAPLPREPEIAVPGDFYLFSFPELRFTEPPADEIIIYNGTNYEAIDETEKEGIYGGGSYDWRAGYTSGPFFWTDGTNVVSHWARGQGTNPNPASDTTQYYRSRYGRPYSTSLADNLNRTWFSDSVVLNGVLFGQIPLGYNGILGAAIHAPTGNMLVIMTKGEDAPTYGNVYVLSGRKEGGEISWSAISDAIPFYCVQPFQFNSTGTEAVCLGNSQLDRDSDGVDYCLTRTRLTLTIENDLVNDLVTDYEIENRGQLWEINYSPETMTMLTFEGDTAAVWDWRLFTIHDGANMIFLENIDNTAYPDSCTSVRTYSVHTTNERTLINRRWWSQIKYTAQHIIPFFCGYDRDDNLFEYKLKFFVDKDCYWEDTRIETATPYNKRRAFTETRRTTSLYDPGCPAPTIPGCWQEREVVISEGASLSIEAETTWSASRSSSDFYRFRAELLDKADSVVKILQDLRVDGSGSDSAFASTQVSVHNEAVIEPFSCGTQYINTGNSVVKTGIVPPLPLQLQTQYTQLPSMEAGGIQICGIGHTGREAILFTNGGLLDRPLGMWSFSTQMASGGIVTNNTPSQSLSINILEGGGLEVKTQGSGIAIKSWDQTSGAVQFMPQYFDFTTTASQIKEIGAADIMANFFLDGSDIVQSLATSSILCHYRVASIFDSTLPFIEVGAGIYTRELAPLAVDLHQDFTLYPAYPDYNAPEFSLTLLPGVAFAAPVNYQAYLDR